MIRLRRASLPPTPLTQLEALQTQIDILPVYSARVSQAKQQFQRQNKPSNSTFSEVREALTKMCSGARRCCYCEDSYADEVEHIKPKDLYPEETFRWENYLYACGPCNGPKNNQFSVFSSTTGLLTNVTRKRSDPVEAPEHGSPVLINPRWEDSLKFMKLDLRGTFWFVPIKPRGSKDFERADYTIKVLRLNERDALCQAREEAYTSYRARLSEYITRRDAGDSTAQLNRHIRALKRMQHPTVWKEMKRQHQLIPTLKVLFDKAPEALRW